MRIEIHAKKTAANESLRTHIERRLARAIGRFDEFIRHVTVHLSESNGTGGAGTKRCRICVSLSSSGEVEVEDTDADPDALVARATGRVGLAVISELERKLRPRNYRGENE